MFSRPTVFVIGAGCSHDLKLPLGPGLLKKIELTMRDTSSPKHRLLMDAFLRCGVPGVNADLERRWNNFAAGLRAVPSIDQYLHFHRDDPVLTVLGKLAITVEILAAEADLELGDKRIGNTMPTCWLGPLFHLLFPDVEKSDPSMLFSNVSFITFNYDRVIEVFLLRALMSVAHIDYSHALEEIAKLKIWHLYGSAGAITGDHTGISSAYPAFTERGIDEYSVVKSAKGIRIFTEGMGDPQISNSVKEELLSASQIIFLGFSYLQQNMDLLNVAPSGTSARIYGTTYQMSNENADIARQRIVRALGPSHEAAVIDLRIQMYDSNAIDFMVRLGSTLQS